MSRKIELQPAVASDDFALKELLRKTPMPGQITLTMEREPSFFKAEQAGNRESQVVVYRDTENNDIYGLGVRAIRDAFIDGEAKSVGYLSALRVLPEARGGSGIFRGYNYLKKLHQDGQVPFYYTTILGENTYAQNLLTSGRASLPIYQPITDICSFLIPIKAHRRGAPTTVERISDPAQLPSAVEFLNTWNSQFQLAPTYTINDLNGNTLLLPDFDWHNLYVKKNQEKIQGTLGIWDQSSIKQVVVTDYSSKMRFARPLYNAYAKLRSFPALPMVGEQIKFLYGSFISSQDNDQGIFKELLDQAIFDFSGRGYDYLTVGFSQDNPLASVAQKVALRQLLSKAYLVYWKDQKTSLPNLEKPIHLEIATL